MPLEYISEALVNELKGPGTLRPGQRKASVCPKESPYPKRACHWTKQQCGPLTVVTEQGRPMEAMVFTVADQFVEEAKQSRSIDVIYYPDINEYNGNRTLQIVVRAYKLHS